MTDSEKTCLHLVPGTMCDARLWHSMLPHLASFTVSFADYSGAETLEDMVAAVARDVPEGAHLVGFSLGGYLAAEAATRNRLPIKSLTLVATAAAGLSPQEKQLRRSNADVIARSNYRGMSRKRLAQFVHADNLGDEAITGTILAMERDLGRDELVRQLLATIERRSLADILPSVNVPVTLVAAAEDGITDSEPMAAIAKAGLADLYWIGPPEAVTGHMIPLEAPEALANTLQQIVSKN